MSPTNGSPAARMWSSEAGFGANIRLGPATYSAYALPGRDLRNYGGADAYLSTCPSRKVLEVLANKWTALLIPALRRAPMRFGELRRRLDGITQKSLTQALRTLELTDLGREAAELLDGLHVWAEHNLAAVLEARSSYDARVATSTAS